MRKYDSYKDSGIEWIGEIPSHWDSVKLKFRGESIIGITYSPDDVVNEGEGILVLRSSNIQDGKLAFDDCVFVDKPIQEKQLTKEGDILLCARNGSAHLVGKAAYIDKQNEGTSFGAFMSIVRSDLAKYLFHFFSSQVFKAQTGLFSTSTINQLTADTLNNMFISIPVQKEEQIAIATFLDRKTAEIDKLIANKKRLLELYEEEKSAIINQAVTKGLNHNVPMKDSGIEWLSEIPEHWEVKRLKYVLKSVTGGGTPSTSNPSYWYGDIPWVTAKDMKVDHLFSSDDYITDVAVKESSTNYIEDERVIVVVRSGILKHTFPVAINKVPISINQDLKALKPISHISNEFLFWKLKGQSKDILTFCSKMGATVDSIDMEYLMDFPFAFPPPQEQQSIAHHIETECVRINSKQNKTGKLIHLLTEYRTALISEVVTGKIKVTA